MALIPLLFNVLLETQGFLAVPSSPTALGPQAHLLNLLHNYILMIMAHSISSNHAMQTPPPTPAPTAQPGLPSCALSCCISDSGQRNPLLPLVYLERKILDALFTYISQNFFVFQTTLALNMEVLCVILAENTDLC